MSALPLVAIIGRANVGKSTLFNRLIQKRTAIVNDAPGVTRDRIYGQSDWLGHFFIVVDTGGVDVDGTNEIELQVVEQALLAQEEADIVIFVADKNVGLTPQDREVVDRIRKSGKPFFFAGKPEGFGKRRDLVLGKFGFSPFRGLAGSRRPERLLR